MKKLIVKDSMTSLELVKQINIFRKKEGKLKTLGHNDLMKVIRDEFEEELREGKISLSSQTVNMPKGGTRKQPLYLLTLSQAKQVLVRESKFVRRAIIQYIEKLEQELNKTKEIKAKEQKKLPFPKEYKQISKGRPLIKIYMSEDNKNFYIDAIELWKFLEAKTSFINWIKRKIEKYDYIEESDYSSINNTYVITLDMAKEIAIMENTPLGRLARRYFIEFELKHKNENKEIEKVSNESERINFYRNKINSMITNYDSVSKFVEILANDGEELKKAITHFNNKMVQVELYITQGKRFLREIQAEENELYFENGKLCVRKLNIQ